MSEKMQWFAYHAARYSPLIRKLTEKQRSDLLLAIDAYIIDGSASDLEPITDIVFSVIKTDIDDSVLQFESRKETNRQNALKRWQKESDQNAIACNGMRSDANHAQYKQNNTNNTIQTEHTNRYAQDPLLADLTPEEIEKYSRSWLDR